jgi:hypothetical protein
MIGVEKSVVLIFAAVDGIFYLSSAKIFKRYHLPEAEFDCYASYFRWFFQMIFIS